MNSHESADTRRAVSQWRGIFEVVALLVAVGAVVPGIGNGIADASGKYGSFWYWNAAFGLPQLALAFAAVLAVVILRVVFTWPRDTPGATARVVLSFALATATLAAVSAGFLLAKPFADHREFAHYDGGEKFGAVLQAIGNAVVAVGLAIVAARSFKAVARRPNVEPAAMSPPT